MTARALAIVVVVAGCETAETCPGETITAGSHHTCAMPGWVDRAFGLDVPTTWDGHSALPVIVLLHGGGGNRNGANRVTCPRGDERDPGCLIAAAMLRGYAVVTPNGTGTRPLRGVRTWNAGGGHALQCVSGGACRSGVDDLSYFDELFDQIAGTLPLDPKRLFITGISNGGGMSHRLACQRPERVAAIVAVSGENEWADDGGACVAQVPVRDIHGTADPCWFFSGGSSACAQEDGQPKTSVEATLEGWRIRNGCAATFTEVPRAERDPNDGTTITIRTYDGCAAATELLRVDGGGHTWPGGWPYLSSVGPVSHEDDNADVLDFFDAHPHL